MFKSKSLLRREKKSPKKKSPKSLKKSNVKRKSTVKSSNKVGVSKKSSLRKSSKKSSLRKSSKKSSLRKKPKVMRGGALDIDPAKIGSYGALIETFVLNPDEKTQIKSFVTKANGMSLKTRKSINDHIQRNILSIRPDGSSEATVGSIIESIRTSNEDVQAYILRDCVNVKNEQVNARTFKSTYNSRGLDTFPKYMQTFLRTKNITNVTYEDFVRKLIAFSTFVNGQIQGQVGGEGNPLIGVVREGIKGLGIGCLLITFSWILVPYVVVSTIVDKIKDDPGFTTAALSDLFAGR